VREAAPAKILGWSLKIMTFLLMTTSVASQDIITQVMSHLNTLERASPEYSNSTKVILYK
jgi:hypothetical protein